MVRSWVKDNILVWPYVATLPLLAAAFGMSCFFTGTDTFWFAPPLVCLFTMLFIAAAPGFRNGFMPPRSVTAIMIVLFGVYTAISTFWSQAPYISILFAFVLTALPLTFLIIVCLPRPLLAARLHAGALVVVLCGFAAWALIQFFFMYEKYGPRIHHPMLSPNNLAVLFMIGLFMAMALFMRARRGWALAGSFALAALMILALIMTQSRGGLFSMLGAMVIFMVMCRKSPGFHWSKPVGLLVVLGLSMLVVNIGTNGWFSSNMSGLTQMAYLNSLTDRLSLYQSGLAILRDHFWGGIGLGTFYFTYPSYRSKTDFSDGYFVHMDPLQYGLEMGIIAPVLFYGIMIAILVRTVRAWRAAPRESTLRPEMMAAFCGMLAVVTHTHIDFHLYILVSLIAMAVPLAWWYTATEAALGEKRTAFVIPHVRPWAGRLVLAVVLVALVGWPVRAAITTITLPKAQADIDTGRLEDAQRRLNRIARYTPRTNYRFYQTAGRLSAQVLTMSGQQMGKDEARKVLERGLAAYDRAIKYNGDFTGPTSDRAKLYFVAHGWLLPDGYAKAEKDLVYVTEHNPLDWDARAGLATIYQLQGYFKRAARVLERGREWPLPRGPAGVNLIVMEAEMHRKMGDIDAYRQLMFRAQEFATQNGLVQKPVTPPAE
jgi:O-antigen ligase